MSTAQNQSQRRAFAGLSISEVARVTGLERSDIHRAAELAQLGAPGDFTYPRSEVVYTERGLSALVESLPKLGLLEAGKALAARLAQERAALAAAKRPLGWFATWERVQDARDAA